MLQMTHTWISLPKPSSLCHHSDFSPILSGLDCLSNPLFLQLCLFAITLVFPDPPSSPAHSLSNYFTLSCMIILVWIMLLVSLPYLSLCIFYVCHIVKIYVETNKEL